VSVQALEPLKPKENEILLRKAKETNDPATVELFFAHNYRLIIFVARKFTSTGIDLDELIGIVQMGFVKAFNSFDLRKEVKFATYATRCMDNEVFMYLRKHKKHSRNTSLDAPLSVDWDGNELMLQDVLEAPETGEYDRYADRSALVFLLDELEGKISKRDMLILKLRYAEGKTQKEVSELLHISQSYVSRIGTRGLDKIRKIAVQKGMMDMPIEKVEGVKEPVAKVDKGKLKWFFENTILSSPEVARTLGCSQPSVSKYRKSFEKGKFDYPADPSANELYQQYLTTLTAEQKKRTDNRAKRRKEADRTAPSEVHTYHIAPEIREVQQEEVAPEVQQEVAATIEEPAPPSEVCTEEPAITLTLDRASVDNIADFMEVVMNQLERGKTYRFHIETSAV
jgi:RNA polymerase sporulation-specific sigma factor